MKKFLILGFALLMLSARLPAQTGVSGNLTAQTTTCLVSNSCLELDVPQNAGGATFKLSGTMNVVVQFEASADPLTVALASAKWVALSVNPSDGTAAATSATESGSNLSVAFQANVSGYRRVRIRVSTYTSGTVGAAINLSTASARTSGSGGGGSIASCTTTGGVAFENGTNNTLTCTADLTWVPGTGNPAGLIIDNAATITSSNPLLGSSTSGEITINSPNTNSSDVVGVSASGNGHGSGTFSGGIFGISGTANYDGSGTVAELAANGAETNSNSGGGAVTLSVGYDCGDQQGVSATLNACYYAPDQGSGANDYAIYTVGGKIHEGPTNTAGIPANNGSSIFYATNYGVEAGGFKFCDANVPAAGNIVTVGNDAQQKDPDLTTLGITTSWIAWVTTWNCSSFNPTFAILNAVGTVASVDSATQLHLSTSSASSCAAATGGTVNKCTLFLFPKDDTTAIQTAWSASTVQGGCGELHLWSGIALISTLPLASTGGCAANNTGNGSWHGVSVVGEGVNATVLVVNPTTNVSGCAANTGCLFAMPATSSAQNDIHLTGFSVDGGGQSAPPGNTSEAIALGADSTADQVGIFAWGIVTGMLTNGSNNAPVILRNVTMAGVGSSGGGELNAGPSTFNYACNLFWSPGILATYQGNTTFGQTYSSGCSYGYGLNANGLVQIPSSKFHVADGDYCNNTPVNNQACWYNNGGTLTMEGTNTVLPVATGNIGIHATNTAFTIFHGFNFVNMNGASGIGYKGDAGSTAYDTGWFDANPSTTPFSVAGTFVPNPTITYPSSMSKVGATGTGACATITTITGNIINGSLKCTGTTGASTLTLTPGLTATNGWNCRSSQDITTPANTFTQNTVGTGTCVLTFGTITQNDVIMFNAQQF